MNNFIAIHILPWHKAMRTLFPPRFHITVHDSEHTMNLLGMRVTVERHQGVSRKWPLYALAMGGAAASVVAAGTAYAFWTTAGTGAGTAQAKPFTALSVGAGSAPAGQLFPGLQADGSSVGGDIVLSVTNSNDFPVQITGVQAGTGAISVTNATPTGAETQTDANNACAASTGVSIMTKTNPTVVYQSGSSVPANRSTAFAVTIKNVVSMSNASVTECQGATFTFPSTGISLTYTSA